MLFLAWKRPEEKIIKNAAYLRHPYILKATRISMRQIVLNRISVETGEFNDIPRSNAASPLVEMSHGSSWRVCSSYSKVPVLVRASCGVVPCSHEKRCEWFRSIECQNHSLQSESIVRRTRIYCRSKVLDICPSPDGQKRKWTG
jgi:hypothetical protein